MEFKEDKSLCPAGRAHIGAQLLGVRLETGIIAILPQVFDVDKAFIEIASQDGVPPEEKFRFVNKCLEGGCLQWDGTRCSLADNLVKSWDQSLNSAAIPECSIKSHCRWHKQWQDKACRICPYIVTQVTEEERDRYFDVHPDFH